MFEINSTIILLSFSISYHHLWYQTTFQIMEEDILNYLPTVMFRGTPCILLFLFLTEEQRKKEGLNLKIQTPIKVYQFLRPGRLFT